MLQPRPRPKLIDRDNITRILLEFGGAPYEYGGQGLDGIDCSGLVMEMFAALGYKLPDMGAAGLREYFKGCEIKQENALPGDLYFYGDPITHVTICLRAWPSGYKMIIGANSGGPGIKADADAWHNNAFVKIERDIYWLNNLKCIVNPFKKLEV